MPESPAVAVSHHGVDPGRLTEVSPDAVIVIDDAGRILYANPATEELLGFDAAEIVGSDGFSFVHPDDVMLVLSSIKTIQPKDRGTPIEVRIRTRTDGWRWLEVIGRDCRHVPGISGIVCVGRDLTDRRMWEIAANDLTRFQQIVQQAATIVLCLDSQWVVTSVNGAFGRLLGYNPSVVVGSLLSDFAAPGQAALLDDAMAVSAPGGAIAVEVSMTRASGDGSVPIRFEIVNLLDDPVVSGIVVSGQDVTDLQEVRRRLEHMANHDPLTGLPNRTLLGERLGELLLTGAPLAVLFVDLDGFKNVNDTLGHEAGDELLSYAAQRLTRDLATTDLVSRVGGDEFIVVAKGIDNRDDGSVVAERLQRALRVPFNLTAGTACIDASVGMVVASPGHTVPSLLSEADLDMYAAKRSRSSEWQGRLTPAG